MAKQKQHCCKSCPWLDIEDRKVYFEPKNLMYKMRHYLRNGLIHHCHSNEEYLCPGQIAFIDETIGLKNFPHTKAIDRGLITEEIVYSSLQEMEQGHKDAQEADRLIF
ncbi:MAG: hypothetical protein F6K55_03330 [Moorea sp. SIO4A3]|nr:hypothetical protein [Moorena sp. SIO4A3]